MTPKLSSYRPGRWAAALAVVALLSVVFNVRPDNSPHKWTEFETVAGQPYPVPKHWLATPNGRLTHNLKLPEAMPKPVPFNFTLAYLKALVPFTDSVGDQYWQHLCATEAGQYIFKTVKPVEGLALMRIGTVPFEEEDEADTDPWMYESGFLEIHIGHRKTPQNLAGGFINWPFYTYAFAEVPNPNGTIWSRVTRLSEQSASYSNAVETGRWKVEHIDGPSARYAITWRGLTRPHDRANRIAGFELIVFDRRSSEILSVLRNFQRGIQTWRSGRGCRELYSSYAAPEDFPEVLLALRTLQTEKESTFLKSNDQRVLRRLGR